MSGGPNYLDSLAGPAFPTMTITRWHWSEWPRLVRGQCVTAQGRYWRVTDVHADLSGNETYSLEPGEVVDARIEYERKQRRSS